MVKRLPISTVQLIQSQGAAALSAKMSQTRDRERDNGGEGTWPDRGEHDISFSRDSGVI